MMPTSRFFSRMPATPNPLPVISMSTSGMSEDAGSRGSSSPVCMISLTVISLRPSDPPGCQRWNSSGEQPRRRISVRASASPRAICRVVDVVGCSHRDVLFIGTVSINYRLNLFHQGVIVVLIINSFLPASPDRNPHGELQLKSEIQSAVRL